MSADRGVSTAVGYVLILGITTILISGLLIAAGGTVEDRRDATARNTLDVVGQRIAANLMAADRLSRTDGATAVAVTVDAPERIAGSGYVVRVNGSASTITLDSDGADATRSVAFVSQTPTATTAVRGGSLRIVLTAGELEVRAA
jgi:uncharacterized protein YcgI (DUF1989 family)